MKSHARASITSMSSVILGPRPEPDDYSRLAEFYRLEAARLDDLARKTDREDRLKRTRRGRLGTGKLFVRWENTKQSKSGKLYISRRLHDETGTPLKVSLHSEGTGFLIRSIPFESHDGFELTISPRRGAIPFVYMKKDIARQFFDIEDETRKTVQIDNDGIHVLNKKA